MKFAAVGLLAVQFWLSMWCCCHMPLPFTQSPAAEAACQEVAVAPPAHGCCSSSETEQVSRPPKNPSRVTVAPPCGCQDHGASRTAVASAAVAGDLEAPFIAAPDFDAFHALLLPIDDAMVRANERAGRVERPTPRPQLALLQRFLI